jgi:di/tricarboxylate transporter
LAGLPPNHSPLEEERFVFGIFWWVRQIVLILVGCFFTVFGILVLMSAYKLKDPYSFIMAFFASNLMILISATVVLGLVLRTVKAYRLSKDNNH